ncbi:MAG: ribonuclease III [Acidobacteria bacterium]|nr:ribonuclease III [Acidobacteriota bacterium]
MRQEFAALEARIGHVFANQDLLEQALTHRSVSGAARSDGGYPHPVDNERLEFLGDAILGFHISEYLIEQFPDLPEGDLSKIRAQFVNANHLFAVGQRLGLGDWLVLGKGEEVTGGRGKRALVADAVEAVIAAVYLDAGVAASRDLVVQHIVGEVSRQEMTQEIPRKDSKSVLQEMAQVEGWPHPKYVTLAENGPEHAKEFLVEVRVGREHAAQGKGNSKKSAGQAAARHLLLTLEGSQHAPAE